MATAHPLPSYLVKRFQGWKATEFDKNRAWYNHLADEGQHPRAMVISCCDSRVHVTSIFGAETGEFFIHRNIANLVPPYAPNEDFHGTSAAIEYAVKALKVAHLIVIGHSACGGVQHFHDVSAAKNPGDFPKFEFISHWIRILEPAWARFRKLGKDAPMSELEKQAVVVSLENLMTFPFVRDAVESDRLTVHGLWNDIGTGGLQFFDGATGGFKPV